MTDFSWVKEFPSSIMVCDAEGVLVEMNDKAAAQIEADGGRELSGKSLLDCHPEPARAKLVELLRTRQASVYTIEKRGVKKLIYQSPWYRDGKFAGLVEMSIVIPEEMPHFVRQG